jgi:hypothetical protein
VVHQPTPRDASPENGDWQRIKERTAVAIPKDGNEWEFKEVMKTGGGGLCMDGK